MFEKVNPSHPDKVADRIAGAVVDLAYTKADNPKIAVEVLLGHGECTVMIEASVMIWDTEVEDIVHRIAGNSILVHTKLTSQDIHLANNQQGAVRCGDRSANVVRRLLPRSTSGRLLLKGRKKGRKNGIIAPQGRIRLAA